jgi:N-acylneuraminate cytidylyltransferase
LNTSSLDLPANSCQEFSKLLRENMKKKTLRKSSAAKPALDRARGARKLNPKLLVFDFDGVLTDNRVLVFSDGMEAVYCNRSDGIAFGMFKDAGIPVLILSKERNSVVAARAKKLDVPCFHAIDDKLETLTAYCSKRKIPLSEVWYVGNDLNDLRIMQAVGYTACPADSHPQILEVSAFKLRTNGGQGVARELAERILGLKYEDRKG